MKNIEFLNHSVIAHRGIYNNITTYENTLESILYAVKNDLTVEIDVRLTKDNNLIVFHDSNGARLLKLKDDINTLTKEELDFIASFHIPTLDEVLNIISGKVPIIIEIKEDNKVIRKRTNDTLKKYEGDFAIQSFIYDSVKYYKKKGFISGLLISDKKNKNYLSKDINVDFLSIKYNILNISELKLLKEKYYVIGWTLNNINEVKENIKIFDNLIIDDVEEVFK